MLLKFSAGKFEVEATTDGFPLWTKITYKDGKQEIVTVHHSELRDLEYIIGRMRNAMRAALPTNYKHEMD